MRIDTQLSVFLENKPGTLARLCEALAEKDINLLALTVSDTVDHAVVRVLVDRPDDALHVLGEAGMLVVENEVVVVEVPNKPGALGRAARKLADCDVNIEYAYCTAGKDWDEGCLVIRTRDPEAAARVLQED